MSFRRPIPLLLLGVLLTAACGVETENNPYDGLTGPSNGCTGCQDVVAVRVDPPQVVMVVGETVQITGEAINSANEVLVGRTIAWTATNDDIARVTAGGLVTAFGVGVVTVTGSTGGVSGTSIVTVEPAPDGP